MWRLWDGETEISLPIKDCNFFDSMARGSVISLGDYLRVLIHTESYFEGEQLKTRSAVMRVLAHIRRDMLPARRRLLLADNSSRGVYNVAHP
jgi:hypothetical protein